MELQQLIYFQAVARLENISEAAEQLHVSQPAISISIKRLEEELGIPLFDRYKKSLKLNRYGKAYLMRIDAAIDQFEIAKKEIEEMYQSQQNRIVVMSGSHEIRPEIIDKLYKVIPNAIIENRNSDSKTAIKQLIDETVDLCILNRELHDPGVATIPLLRQQFGVVLSDKHWLAESDEIDLKDLENEKFAAYSEGRGAREVINKLFEQGGFVPKIIFESSSTQPMFEPIKAGLCIALMTFAPYEKYFTGGTKWIPLKNKDCYALRSIMYKKGKTQNRAIREYVRIILESYGVPLSTINDPNII